MANDAEQSMNENKVPPGGLEPFGRQPKPVKVILAGESIDVNHYTAKLRRFIVNQGDDTIVNRDGFTIYPRAVND